MAPLPYDCDRARAWVSLKLDGELSELEGFMLEGHIERCKTCWAFAAEAVGFTETLRTAPLHPRERHEMLSVRRRSIGRRAVQFGIAAALVAASVGLGSILGMVGSGGGGTPSPQNQLRPAPIVYPAPITNAKPLVLPGIAPAVERVGRRSLNLTADAF
jgi:hypothetical protein